MRTPGSTKSPGAILDAEGARRAAGRTARSSIPCLKPGTDRRPTAKACPFCFVRPKGSMRTPGSTKSPGAILDAAGARRAAGRTARRPSPPRRSLPSKVLWRPAFFSGAAARPREGTAQCHYLVAGGSVSFPSNRAAKMTPSESDSPDPLQRRRISASWALS